LHGVGLMLDSCGHAGCDSATNVPPVHGRPDKVDIMGSGEATGRPVTDTGQECRGVAARDEEWAVTEAVKVHYR
jgi:hypothetical protein